MDKRAFWPGVSAWPMAMPANCLGALTKHACILHSHALTRQATLFRAVVGQGPREISKVHQRVIKFSNFSYVFQLKLQYLYFGKRRAWVADENASC